MKNQKTYFLDLFSGIGGFALGAYWAGLRFDNHYYSEVDNYAIRVYQQRFPDAIGLGDICKIKGSDLPAGDWIISGGFPCQPFSNASRGRKVAIDMWPEMRRVVYEIKPRFVIAENVSYTPIAQAVCDMREIGYSAYPFFIPSSCLGTAHNRERYWMVANTNSDGEPHGPIHEKMEKLSNIAELGAEINPRTLGIDDGIPSRMDRLKCLGNSIVPQIAQLIFAQPAFDEWRLA